MLKLRDRGGVITGFILAGLLSSGAGCDSSPSPSFAKPGTGPAATATNSQGRLQTRVPAVAGLFYPADKTALSQTVDGLLNRASEHHIPRLRGLICPHAGYAFSGLTAAGAYRALAGREIQTVVILAPSHYAAFQGVSIPTVDAYESPLGTVPVSPKARRLAGIGPFIPEQPCQVQRPSWSVQSLKPAPPAGQDTPETWEHSVEVQLPFLQKTVQHFEILPILFGDADPEQVADGMAKTIDDRTVVVASSDLSHYHSDDQAKELDKRCIETICNLDTEAMKTQEACGKLPVLTLLHLARKKGWKAALLDYRNSGDVSGDKDHVVGYAAIAFYEPTPEQVGAPERKLLLDLARTTLQRVATNGTLPDVSPLSLPPKLTEANACFVTLTENGSLRGCIGHIQPQESLYQAVIHNAKNAATRDPRFPPVQPHEVDSIKIEVSVLTRPQPLSFASPEELLERLQPHEDGVVLEIAGRAATFLPQVWAQIPDKVEFMNRLAQKAGCAPSAWKGKDTAVSVYHVQAFGE